MKVILFSLFLAGCRLQESESPTIDECNALVHTFFKMSHHRQLAAFPKLAFERQYVTYMCGMRRIHPPTLHLVDAFAKEGKVAFPRLTEKIVVTRNDASFRNVLHVFGEMQRTHTYDVRAETALLHYLNSRAAAMPDKFWRDYTQKLIGDIENPQRH